jgi:hypothetical protein
VFDGIATHQEPVFVVGDRNIRFHRSDDPHARQLNDLVTDYDFAVQPTTLTHNWGGTIDAIITRIDSSCPIVSCVDVGLSDHFMLQRSVIAERPSSPTTIEYVTQRPWRQLDIDEFRAALMDSVLCRPSVWPDDVDQLANLYDSTLTELLDRIIPFRQFTRRPRASDPCFDYECCLRRGRPGDLSVLTQLLPGILLLAILTLPSVLRKLLGTPNESNIGICASTSVEQFG